MKYLTSYKVFESSPSGDVFPEYHTLAGMEINRVLENILASLPQEEVKYYNRSQQQTLGNSDYNKDTYETYVDVDTESGIKRVNLVVTSGNLSNLSPVFSTITIDKYQVGMRRIAYRLFRKLKSIYNDLFKD